MHTVGDVNVVASLHAAARALERVPVLKGCDHAAACYWVERTAGRALRDGRKARRCPSWCTRDQEEGLKRRARANNLGGHLRFIWNEDETSAMLVRRRMQDGAKLWIVVTVVVRSTTLE